LIFIGSVGLVVRLIAPIITDKRSDPAVVVIDVAGKHVVSVLSGHVGGANALTCRLASILGSEPVITTASDVLDTLAVDLLGSEFGWSVEATDDLTTVSAAIINGRLVGIVQETGEQHWWLRTKPLPANLCLLPTINELHAMAIQAAIVISDRVIDNRAIKNCHNALIPIVIVRPKSLVVGVGCNRGTSAEVIELAVENALREYGLAIASVRNLATVDVKNDERGITEYAQSLGVSVEYFTAQELDSVPLFTEPSHYAKRAVGAWGVCEPAVLLSSRASTLLVPKLKFGDVTVAIARVPFSDITNEEDKTQGV
jgi:cobalt-precorrin 5A hydrolase